MQSLKNQLISLFSFVLLLWVANTSAQTINGVIAESPVHFANTTDFSAGALTITFNMPAGKNSAELEVTLPKGIEYVASSVAATVGTVALKSGSTDPNKPVFTISATGGTAVTVSLKRKVTKAILSNPNLGDGLHDSAILKIDGKSSPAKQNETA